MGELRFRIPPDCPPSLVRDLQRSCVAGGYDAMPGTSRVTITGDVLTIQRESSESGSLVAPFDLPGVGCFLGTTGTLVERDQPYDLLVELARGKVNRLRNQAADWSHGGMAFSPELAEALHSAGLAFARVAAHDGDRAEVARSALMAASRASDMLVDSYSAQLLKIRHARQGPLDASVGVRINGGIPPAAERPLLESVTSVVLPMTWRTVEPAEANYQWEIVDQSLAWAEKNQLGVAAGPLIDMSPGGLPDWLWLWEGDLQSIASFCCDYVETTVGRYRNRVRRWHLASAMNLVGVLRLGEEELLWLTARLAEAAWQVDPAAELVLGVAQPWGEYLARREHNYSPFIFVDTLIRAGLKLTGLELEMLYRCDPRGSFARDLLDASRILDLYSLLGVPLQALLSCPAAESADPLADPQQSVGSSGYWRGPATAENQASWAAAFGRLAISKPYVKSIVWSHLSDAEAHMAPNAGLFDAAGRVRPALAEWRRIREEHLR
jgi:hypothetical protein